MKDWPALDVLDLTDPQTLRDLARRLNLAQELYDALRALAEATERDRFSDEWPYREYEAALVVLEKAAKPTVPSKALEVGKRVIADNRDVLDRLRAAYCGECGMHPAHLPEPCTQVDLVAHIPPETGRIECKCGHPAKTSDRRSDGR